MYTGSLFLDQRIQVQITLEALRQQACLLQRWPSRCEGRSDLYLERLSRVSSCFPLPFQDVEFANPPGVEIAYRPRGFYKEQTHSFLSEPGYLAAKTPV